MAQELKAKTIVPQGSTVTLQMYPKGEVDAVLAEKDAEIRRLKEKLNETTDKVYVVIEFDRETDEFSEVEGVFQSKEEGEDFAKDCSARYLRYSYGCYEGTIAR